MCGRVKEFRMMPSILNSWVKGNEMVKPGGRKILLEAGTAVNSSVFDMFHFRQVDMPPSEYVSEAQRQGLSDDINLGIGDYINIGCPPKCVRPL